MRVERVVPILTVTDMATAVAEHQAATGLEVLMEHGWVTFLGTADGRHQVGLITRDATAPVNPAVSLFVDDVHEALRRVEEAGLEVVHPLTREPWGVLRFFYRDSQGTVINVGTHAQ